MILEIAQVQVKPGMEQSFEDGVRQAVPVFKRVKGCHGLELQRSIEVPSHYRLFVKWETVEHHTEGFRNSPEFTEWRKLVGHCFDGAPVVEHLRQVAHGF